MFIGLITAETSTFKPSLIRTEIRVAKSLRPEETQEINVRSNNGGFAKIVVKKRDSKTASLIPRTAAIYNTQPNFEGTYQATRLEPIAHSAPKWTPFQQTSLINSYNEHPVTFVSPSYRFDSPKSESDNGLINSFINHISQLEKVSSRGSSTVNFGKLYKPNSMRGDAVETKRHDLVTLSRSQQNFLVPKPVFVTSHPMQFTSSEESTKFKRGRSLMKIDGDGIPIVEGIRMPDDEQDKTKTWRNGRVINGELVPYEPGYVPKKAVPLLGDYGQLLFVKATSDDKPHSRSFGPFTKSDNFKDAKSTGPFTIDDNHRSAEARSDSSVEVKKPGSIGPFTVKDNSRIASSKLIDYIKTINDEESRRRDLFQSRHNFKRDAFFTEDKHQPKMQRRMLENAGDLTYGTPKYYAKDGQPINAAEGSRSPVLEYAHPEFGIQAATNNYSPTTSKPKVQYYASTPSNTPMTLQKHEYFPQSLNKYLSSEYPNPYQSQYSNSEGIPFGIRKVKDQPFYVRLAEQMRDSVQSGFAIVMKPFVEVGQKITKNLGIGRSFSNPNEKDLYIFMQNDGSNNADQINSDISAGENKVRVKRHDDHSDISISHLYNKNDKHDDETQFIEVIDVIGNNGPLRGYGKNSFDISNIHVGNVRSADNSVHQIRGKRQKYHDFQNLGEILLQDIESESIEQSDQFGDNYRVIIQNTDWTNTQCAKRVFCEVMLQQSSDDMTLMEKKMRKLLPM